MAVVHIPPRHVIYDIKSPGGGAALAIVAIAWLVGRHLTTGQGGRFGELGVIAATLTALDRARLADRPAPDRE